MKNKQPPFQITNKIIDDVIEISVRIPVKRSARSGGTVRPFQRKRRSRSIPNGVKRRPSVLSGQRPQFLTELWPLVS